MAPRGRRAGGEDLLERPFTGFDAWDLCRGFVDQVVSDALATSGSGQAGTAALEVDWDAIWRAGDGAPSDEVAIGRIVRAASGVATEIAGERPLVGQGRPTAVMAAEVAVVDPGVPEEVLTSPEEPVLAAEEPVTTVVAPVLAAQEPAPTALVNTPTVVEVPPDEQPGTHATSLLEPAEPEQLLVAPAVLSESDESEDEKAAAAMARRHFGWATAFTWIRNLGAIILLFVAWQLWGTSISQHQDQSQLKSAFDAAVRAHHPPKATGAGPALIPAATRVASPPDGTVVARIQIPVIGVDQYVVSGTNATDLSKGPGHYIGTAVPGQAGNVAIAGHRTTHGAPFNRLGQLVKGDQIYLTTISGEHLTYVVSGTPQAVSPSDVAVLNYFGDNRITLTTCTPEFSASQRLIAVGTLKESGAATATAPPAHVTYHVENAATASWNWSLLPGVGFVVCLLLLLGLSYRRFDGWFGRIGKWFILVPLWSAGLYLLFALLTTFLPETL
jgi:sortase A